MKDIVDIIHENPEATILIEKTFPEVVRIDVDEYGNFDSTVGKNLGDVGISEQEKERRKRRKDLKLKLSDVDNIRQVYTISRINEEDDESQTSDLKDVQEQQRNRRSPGS